MSTGTVQGKDFFELIKAIGESKSKQEEDRIIAEEVAFLKKKISEQGIPKKKVKEFLIRAIYVEMLGQDASYAYIRAVELCASTNIAQKRTGYLLGMVQRNYFEQCMIVSIVQHHYASLLLMNLDLCLSIKYSVT